MLFNWLVTGQVIPSNPAHAVRGRRHSVQKGATAVISSAEARELLDSMKVSTVVGLRDRALAARGGTRRIQAATGTEDTAG
jgi:site-specific recombinase XerD